MKDMLTVLSYTIKENITKKSFIITTIILMAMIILVCNIPNIISLFEGEDFAQENSKYFVVDEQNLVGEELSSLIEIGKLSYMDIEVKDTVTEEITEQIKNSEADGLIEILKTNV